MHPQNDEGCFGAQFWTSEKHADLANQTRVFKEQQDSGERRPDTTRNL